MPLIILYLKLPCSYVSGVKLCDSCGQKSGLFSSRTIHNFVNNRLRILRWMDGFSSSQIGVGVGRGLRGLPQCDLMASLLIHYWAFRDHENLPNSKVILPKRIQNLGKQ